MSHSLKKVTRDAIEKRIKGGDAVLDSCWRCLTEDQKTAAIISADAIAKSRCLCRNVRKARRTLFHEKVLAE